MFNFHWKDPLFFVKNHQNLTDDITPSYTTARVLYYPPLPSSSHIKPGQLRCGEHVDYGSITLLFQDPSGGLQVSLMYYYCKCIITLG